MSNRKRVTPSIYRRVKSAALAAKRTNKWNADVVAKDHGVSASTVRAIVASKSWPKYQEKNRATNEARHDRRRAAGIDTQDASKVAVDREEQVTDQLDEAIKSLAQRATKLELSREVTILHERLDIQYAAVRLILNSWIGRLVLGGGRAQARAISRLAIDHQIAKKSVGIYRSRERVER